MAKWGYWSNLEMEYLVKVRISFWKKLHQEDLEFWHLVIWTSSYPGHILLWEKLLPKAQLFSLNLQHYHPKDSCSTWRTGPSKKTKRTTNAGASLAIVIDGSKNWTCFGVSTSNWVLKRWRVAQITFQPLLERSSNSKVETTGWFLLGGISPRKCSFHFLCRLWGWFVVPGGRLCNLSLRLPLCRWWRFACVAFHLCFVASSFLLGLSFFSFGCDVNLFLLGPSSRNLFRRNLFRRRLLLRRSFGFGWSLHVSAPAWFDCFCCMLITFAFNISLFGFLWLVPSCCSRFLHLFATFPSPSPSPFSFWFWYFFTLLPFLITLSKAPDLCSNLQLLSSGHLDLCRENGAEMAGLRHHTFYGRVVKL